MADATSAASSGVLQLRPYQEKVVAAALLQNTLAVMPTGSGKTLVAIHVIMHRLRRLREQVHTPETPRRIVAFLAPTKVLVGQQKRYIATHSDAKVLEITGETSTIDGHGKHHWNTIGWNELFSQYEVVVMTPQVLRLLLQKNLFCTSQLDTLIVDECHHAFRHDPLTVICRIIRESNADTLILALTASPVQCKTGSVLDQIQRLEENLGCKMLCTKEILEEYRASAPTASLSIFRYPSNSSSVFERIVTGIDATQTAGLRGGGTSGLKKEKRSQRSARIEFPSTISVGSDASCLLFFAYLRARHAMLVKSIYSCLSTMLTNPTEVKELRGISLPTVLDYRNYLRGVPFPESGDWQHPTPHVLGTHHAVFPMLADAVSSFGQVLTIVEECGVISGVYSLILSIEDQILSKFALKEPALRSRNGGKNRIGERGYASKRTRGSGMGSRSSKLASYYDQNTHTYIDGDKLDGMAKELVSSPFALVDLLHDQYVTCLSLLDFFFAYCGYLGPEVCSRAVANFVFSCKRSAGKVSFTVHEDSEENNAGESIGLSRMNAIIYLLLQSIANGEARSFELTSEGCLSHIAPTLRKNAIFDQFKLRLDVCAEVVKRACWALIRSLTVPDLRRWTRVDEEIRYCTFEPLLFDSAHDGEEPNWDGDDGGSAPQNAAVSEFPKLEPVSSKLKAVYHVWTEINKEKDFALQWLENQTHILDAMMSMEGSDASPMLNDQKQVNGKIQGHEDPSCMQAYGITRSVTMTEEIEPEQVATDSSPACAASQDDHSPSHPSTPAATPIPPAPAAEPAASFSDVSYIVFCKKRLTARSIHFVLSIILENDFGDAESSLDDQEELEDAVEERSESLELAGRVASMSTPAQDVESCVADLVQQVERRVQSQEDDSTTMEVRQCIESMVSAIELRLYGFGLLERLREIATRKDAQLIQVPAFRPTHLIGGTKQSTQMQTLGKFKSGYYNIVFATDVMEEGLDVKACKYVINFDLPMNVKSFIQRKGRSRADNSMMISLVPLGLQGVKLITELQDLLKQEKLIEDYAGQQEVLESDIEMFVDVGSTSFSFHSTGNIEGNGVFSGSIAGNDCEMLTPDALSDNDLMLEDLVSTTITTFEASQDALPDTNDASGVLDGEAYVVHSTGAEVDSRTAIHVLISFCQQLPHDLVFSYKPIFWMDKVPRTGGSWYKCSILLPPCVHPSIRFIIGPVCRSKAQAKRLASLQAVMELHQRGELDDWLFAHGSAQAARKERLRAQIQAPKSNNGAPLAPKLSASKKLKAKLRSSAALQCEAATCVPTAESPCEFLEETDSAQVAPQEAQTVRAPPPASSSSSSSRENAVVLDDDDIADLNLIKILVKTVPDLLTQAARTKVIDGVRSHRLYFYCTTGEFLNKRCRTITVDCTSCVSYFEGINMVCMAFARKLPDTIFEEPFRCQIRENETIFVRVSFVCCRWVTDAELRQLQLFHRGVLCWETDDLLPGREETKFSDDLWIDHKAKLDLTSRPVIEHDDWRTSSGGSWYILCPPPSIPELEASYCSHDDTPLSVAYKAERYREAMNGVDWLAHVQTAAMEAQILCHNLRVQELLNRSSEPYSSPVFPSAPFEELTDLLVTRGQGGLLSFHRDNAIPAFRADPSKGKRVGDTMKLVVDTVKEETWYILDAMVESIEASSSNGSGDAAMDVSSSSEAPVEVSEARPHLKRYLSWNLPEEEPAGKKQRLSSDQASTQAVQLPPPVHASEGSSEVVAKSSASKSRVPSFLRAVTFAENIVLKFPESAGAMEAWKADPEHRLAKIVPIAGVLTLTNLIGKFILHLKRPPEIVAQYGKYLQASSNNRNMKQQKPHRHSFPIYLPQELLRPIGRHKWLVEGLAAPTIIWRLQSFLLALEARKSLSNVIAGSKSTVGAPIAPSPQVDDLAPPLPPEAEAATAATAESEEKGDGNEEEEESEEEEGEEEEASAVVTGADEVLDLAVKPSLMLDALTPRMGREIVDLERLEMLGDSLLKFVISVEVFRVFPTKHEGFLTAKRSQYISNHFLIEAARRLGLQRYVRAFPLCNGRHHLSVRPAGMTFEAICCGRSIWSANVVAGIVVAAKRSSEENFDAPAANEPTDFRQLEIRKAAQEATSEQEYYRSVYPHGGYQAVALNPKVIADTMEAIIGAYYSHGGISLAVTVIQALGAWPKVSQEIEESSKLSSLMPQEEAAPMDSSESCAACAAASAADGASSRSGQSSCWNEAKDAMRRFFETHRTEEPVSFPDDFPDALRRIALGRVKFTENMLDCEQNLIIDDLDPVSEMNVVDDEDEDEDEDIVPQGRRRDKERGIKVSIAQETASLAIVSDPKEVIEQLHAVLGYQFQNWSLLEEALTHCSTQNVKNNQRLEFLGDAVLDLAVVTLLYHHQPWATQGDLSYQKSEATSNRNLGAVAARLQLFQYLRHCSMAMEMEFASVIATTDKMQTENCVSAEDDTLLSMFSDTYTCTPGAWKAEGVELQMAEQLTADGALSKGSAWPREKAANMPEESIRKPTVKISSSALKALADMFEALMGAIFFDSGGSVEVVQAVIKHIDLLPQLTIAMER